MATFNPLHPLESIIIEIVAAEKGITVKNLHQKLQEQGLEISLNGLYKPINRMFDCQMMAKTNGKIFLNSVWLQHIQQLIITANEKKEDADPTEMTLPLQEGEKYDFNEDSLQNLDSIWNHFLTDLSTSLTSDTWYVYDSHPWYSLGMRDTEQRLYQSVVSHGKKICMLYGNNSFLDQYGSKLVSVPGFTTKISEDAPFPKEGHAIWICGDHIVECVFPEILSRNFAFFFESVKKVSDFNQELFSDVFRMKSQCKVTVRRSAKEAEKLKKILSAYFK